MTKTIRNSEEEFCHPFVVSYTSVGEKNISFTVYHITALKPFPSYCDVTWGPNIKRSVLSGLRWRLRQRLRPLSFLSDLFNHGVLRQCQSLWYSACCCTIIMPFPKSTIFLMVQFSYVLSNKLAFNKIGNDETVLHTHEVQVIVWKRGSFHAFWRHVFQTHVLRHLLSLCFYAYEYIVPCKKIQKWPRAPQN